MRGLLSLFAVVSLVSVLFVAGCGGGDGASAVRAGGSIQVSVLFPPRTAGVAPQDLPLATNSVRIQVLKPSDLSPIVPDVIVPRGSPGPQTVILNNIPVGPCLVRALAYESFDGTGRVIAEAEVLTAISAGEVTKVSLITKALVVRLDVAPATLNLEYTTDSKLTATCYDADDNVVLSSVGWNSDSAAVTVAADGAVHGQSDGSATVTAAHTESGLSDSCAVTVFRRSTEIVRIVPSSHTLRPPRTSSVQLAAAAYDALDAAIPYANITWTSDSAPNVTVSSTGLVNTIATDNLLATITASAGEGTDGECPITVTPEGTLEVSIQ